VLLLLGLFLPGCEDERGTINDPDQPPAGPDSDFIFGTTLFSASVFTVQNTIVDLLRASVLAGRATQPDFSAFGGFVTVDEIAENLFQITFTNFNDPALPIFDTVNGVMMVRMDEVTPGLNYTINPGEEDFLPLGAAPHFVVYQLPADFGDGAAVKVSGTVHGLLDEDSLRHEGFVHQTGTLRMEEPTQRFLFVERLGIEYEFDSDIFPSFSEWPFGAYEVGVFGNGTSSTPFIVSFNGDGGASFPYRDSTCNVNLDVPLDEPESGNPCSGT
jgi:hypothetical protein